MWYVSMFAYQSTVSRYGTGVGRTDSRSHSDRSSSTGRPANCSTALKDRYTVNNCSKLKCFLSTVVSNRGTSVVKSDTLALP